MRRVAVLSARRTAVAPRGGAFRELEAFALAAPLIARAAADAAGAAIDEVILGNALSGGGNVARVAALAAGLPESVPAATLDTQCCSGLDAVRLAAARIAAGEADLVVAGGVESFSRAPLRAVRPRQAGEAPRFYARPPFTPWPERDPDLTEAAAALAGRRRLSRAAQEAFARASHAAALAHPPAGGEIVPLAGLARDPFARRLSPALCARLPLIAGDGAHGVTSATAAVEADGAAVLLLADEASARRLAGPDAPLILVGGTLARGGDPMAPALAPVAAVRALLARTGRRAAEIAHAEIMEAYAAQAMATLDDLAADGLAAGRVNTGGGALARGHPIGASGAVLAVRLWHRLKADPAGPGLAAIAGAGGIASALLLEPEALRRPRGALPSKN